MSDETKSSITEEHRTRLGWLVEAAGRNGLALLEVNETSTGKPAVLIVAIDHDEEGKGGRMAPLARIDVDFAAEFTPPEGVEQVDDEDLPLSDELEKLRRAKEVDNAGEGC